jgi:peptidoglycan/LPS O-acetylase OafA/YrhL
MSYSYYLVHALALNGVFMLTGKLSHGAELGLTSLLLLLPFYFIVTLAASAIPYIFVELRYSLKTTPRKY